MKRYSKKDKEILRKKTKRQKIKSSKVKGRRVKSKVKKERRVKSKVKKGRRVKSRKNKRTRKVGGGIEKEPERTLSSEFGFPAHRERMVLGQQLRKSAARRCKQCVEGTGGFAASATAPVPAAWGQPQKAQPVTASAASLSPWGPSQSQPPTVRPPVHRGRSSRAEARFRKEPSKKRRYSINDSDLPLLPIQEETPNKQFFYQSPRPKIGFVEPDSWAPLHAWPETNEQKFSNPVIVPSGLHDDFTGEIGSGLAERNAEVLPRGDLPPNIVTLHGNQGILYSDASPGTPHQLVEDEYHNYFQKSLQTI
jgi:hypothetical protein